MIGMRILWFPIFSDGILNVRIETPLFNVDAVNIRHYVDGVNMVCYVYPERAGTINQ